MPLPPLTIDILSGHASPWTGSFDKDEVAIGRSALADVRMHAVKDTICASGVHARIKRGASPDGDGGTVPVFDLVVDHENGVTLLRANEADRFLGRGEMVRLAHGDSIVIGKNGPRMAVSIMLGEGLPRTYHENHPGTVSIAPPPLPEARVTHEYILQGRMTMRTAKRLGALLLVLIVIVGVGGVLLWQQWRTTSEQTSALERLIEGRTKNMGSGTTEQVVGVLERARASVCLIGSISPAGVFDGFGTGWTVAPGKIATNAHIAVAATNLRDYSNHRIVARRGPGMDIELTIGAITKHPGYDPWGEKLNELAARTAEGEAFKPIAPCDVAIFEVTAGDAGTPLPLADLDADPIHVGDAVGYVGFPMEEVSGRVSMQAPVGHVSALTDVFFDSRNPADDVLIHHTVFSVGGSSGSPLLNAKGKVIGLVSAGSIVRSPLLLSEGKRIPLGLNYAQRVDFLRELLDGKAAEAQAAREERWTKSAEAMVPSVTTRLDRIAAAYAGQSIKIEQAGEYRFNLTEYGEAGAFTHTIRTETDAEYFVCAVADDFSPLVIVTRNEAGEEREDKRSVPSPECSVAPNAAADKESTVRVWGEVLRSDKPEVTLRVYRVVP